MKICEGEATLGYGNVQEIVHWCWKMDREGARMLGYAETPEGSAMIVFEDLGELAPIIEGASKAQPEFTFVLDQGRLIDALMMSETGLVAIISSADYVRVVGVRHS